MIELTTRLYHCHKLHKHISILEDYEIINGIRTLVHCSCPYYTGTSVKGRKCNGLNDYNLPCGYSVYPDD